MSDSSNAEEVSAGRLVLVDTSSPVESVALLEEGRLLGERNIRRDRSKSPGLLEDILSLCQEQGWELEAIDGFVCGLGPGSFTGLRVGLALLKGLAYGLQRPLYGVPSVTALLAAAPPGAIGLLDVRRGELHAAGGALPGPQTGAAEALLEQLIAAAPPALFGDGALKHREALLARLPGCWIPQEESAHRVRAGFLIAGLGAGALRVEELAALEPLYARASDAEINYPDGFPRGEALLERLSGQRGRARAPRAGRAGRASGAAPSSGAAPALSPAQPSSAAPTRGAAEGGEHG